jgi:glycosyltransferase involved in cell wall biosynthesis
VRQQRGVRGRTPEWTAAWRAADLFVMPTRNEAFGLVYQEAAAAGLPSIGTRLNAVPEIIEDGATGLLITPGDTSGLARAIDALIASAGLRERLGRNARRKIEQDADPDVHRRQLVALITQVASTRQASSIKSG